MIRSTTLIAFLGLSIIVLGQFPNSISYQTEIRYKDELVKSQLVGIKIDLIKDSINGPVLYSETQSYITNPSGQVNLQIGKNNATGKKGSINEIKWHTGPYYIRISLDMSGEGIYQRMITNQLLSVPYAQHSKSAEVLIGDIPESDPVFSRSPSAGITSKDTADWRATTLLHKHFIGELYGGGIIFWVDPDGKHGLIASLHDLDDGKGMKWSMNTEQNIAGANSYYDGRKNTIAIVADNNSRGYAATACNNYSYANYDDWYLPANQELILLMNANYIISPILNQDQNPNTHGLRLIDKFGHYGTYWSSTEFISRNAAWLVHLSRNMLDNDRKDVPKSVRAIRRF